MLALAVLSCAISPLLHMGVVTCGTCVCAITDPLYIPEASLPLLKAIRVAMIRASAARALAVVGALCERVVRSAQLALAGEAGAPLAVILDFPFAVHVAFASVAVVALAGSIV